MLYAAGETRLCTRSSRLGLSIMPAVDMGLLLRGCFRPGMPQPEMPNCGFSDGVQEDEGFTPLSELRMFAEP